MPCLQETPPQLKEHMFTSTQMLAIAVAVVIVGLIIGFYVGANFMRRWYEELE